MANTGQAGLRLLAFLTPPFPPRPGTRAATGSRGGPRAPAAKWDPISTCAEHAHHPSEPMPAASIPRALPAGYR